MRNKRGISLITLIITIVVSIILVAVVIFSLTNKNTIDNSKIANLLQTKSSVENAVTLKISKEISQNLDTYSVRQIILENSETEIIDEDIAPIIVNKNSSELKLYKLDDDYSDKLTLKINNSTRQYNWYTDERGKLYLVYDFMENVPDYMKEGEQLNTNVESFVIILGKALEESIKESVKVELPGVVDVGKGTVKIDVSEVKDLSFCKWKLTNNEEKIGLNEDDYPNTLEGTAEEILINQTEEGEYYLHLLVSTTTGVKTEIVLTKIVVERQCDVWDGTVASGFARGTGSSTDPYIIETGAQLAYLQNQVNVNKNSYYGKYIKMVNSIDLKNIYWAPIGKGASSSTSIGSLYVFSGNFDGCGNSIYNLSVSGGWQYSGFFGNCDSAIIKNLTIESGTVSVPDGSARYAGAIAAFFKNNGNTGKIENCINKINVVGEGGKCGGMLGYLQGSSSTYNMQILNCKNYGKISGYGDGTGGIIGHSTESLTIKNCINYGEIDSISSNYSGGILGYQTTYSVNIEQCGNEGSVKGKQYVGGIVGYGYASGTTIKQCYNTGYIQADTNYAAGILGGPISGSSISIQYCYNKGNVSAYTNYTGGIATHASSIYNCYSSGDIYAPKYESGIASKYSSSSGYSNNYYLSGSAAYALYNKGSYTGKYEAVSSSTLSSEDMITKLNNGSTIYKKSPKEGEYPIFVWQ